VVLSGTVQVCHPALPIDSVAKPILHRGEKGSKQKKIIYKIHDNNEN
jgi:hypothetical protein